MTQLVRKTNDDVIVWCSIVHLKKQIYTVQAILLVTDLAK